MSGNKSGGLVYSTEKGRRCRACGTTVESCLCKTEKIVLTSGSEVRIGRETKGRKGAGVAVVRGLALTAGELKQLAGELKRKCGSGGTVKGSSIEIQGDHRQLLLAELIGKGFKVKLAGG